MPPVKLISSSSAVLSALNGTIIIGNDVLIGIKTSMPAVSVVVGVLFLIIGFLVWQIGTCLNQLRSRLMPEGVIPYQKLSSCLCIAMITYGFLMAGVMYGLCERIAQGNSIFG